MSGPGRRLLLAAAATALAGVAQAQAVPSADAPRIASDTAFTISFEALIPENIARDEERGGFFIGDVLGRRVLYSDPHGSACVFAGPDVVHGAVLGMKPDRARGILWANVQIDRAGAPEDAEASPGAALLAIDLRTGALRRRYLPPDPLAPHLFNDLVVTRAGAVLLTDSRSGRIYRLRGLRDSLRVWLPARDGLSYPNGIALDARERTAYVAHTEGISAVDLHSRRVKRLRTPAGFPLNGIDGLYAVRGLFVGIQNEGAGAGRVLAFTVSDDAVVTQVRELEAGHPAYRVPTTGAVAGDTLYYIANSQLDRLAEARGHGGVLDPIVVLRLPIPPPGAPTARSTCHRRRQRFPLPHVNGASMRFCTQARSRTRSYWLCLRVTSPGSASASRYAWRAASRRPSRSSSIPRQTSAPNCQLGFLPATSGSARSKACSASA